LSVADAAIQKLDRALDLLHPDQDHNGRHGSEVVPALPASNAGEKLNTAGRVA
jgi:hypothetical protein